MDDALALLSLQLEWGADESIGVDPINRLRPVEASPAPRRLAVSPQPLSGAQGSGTQGTPGERALALAGRAATLDDLRAALAGFDGCSLRDTASNLVFAEGDPDSATLIIGEPPGREEDRGGHGFAGPEGQLLDQMLASIGLGRGELMLTPLLPWRPPGGRPASPGEIALCLPFLHRLVGLVKPRRIVLFGATAARAMLPQSPARRRGPRNWVEGAFPGMPAALPVLALPGLADMLKNPPLRRDAWAGLRLLRRAIDQLPTET
ncbi:uracil-DNA glycosylase [Rhodopila sp.]|uniref:uracil-DNA glycosylase n=1 Tax=Rhodopila sp. TaxID=2480087 RepID=UPI003D0B206D